MTTTGSNRPPAKTDDPAPGGPGTGAEAGGTDAAAPVVDTGPVSRRRRVPWAKVLFGIAVSAVALALPFLRSPSENQVLAQVLYLAVAAAGLNLLVGFTGQISIGHGAFFGVGAFTSAILVEDYGWPFEATIAVAAVLSAAVGMVVGFPALRVRGLYLALVTLGLAVLFPPLARKFVEGIANQPLIRPPRGSFNSLIPGLDADQYQYYVCLIAVVIATVVAWNLVHSRTGRAMIATRDQELAAATVGVNLAGIKVGAFAVSAAYAGVAGSLSVMVDKLADGTNPLLYFVSSIEFLIAVVIGGSATIAGPIVGAIVLVFLRRNTEDLVEGEEVLAPAVLGAALIAIIYVLPEGVVGGFHRLAARFSRRRSARQNVGRSDHGPPPPSTTTTT